MKKYSKEDYALAVEVRRQESLQTQHSRVKDRLNRLYDDKYDGGVAEEVFISKELEYKTLLLDLASQIAEAQKINPNFYEDGVKTLELTNLLYPQYVRANHEEKAIVLKKLASNYALFDVTIT